MLGKISFLFVLYQIISLSKEAAIPQQTTSHTTSNTTSNTTTPANATCQKFYGSCTTRNDCCQDLSPLICTGNNVCMYPTDPLGPLPSLVGNAVAMPNPGCGLWLDNCTTLLDCCAPYVCSGNECVQEDLYAPWTG